MSKDRYSIKGADLSIVCSPRQPHNRRFRYGAGAFFPCGCPNGRETVANTFIPMSIVQNRVVTQTVPEGMHQLILLAGKSGRSP